MREEGESNWPGPMETTDDRGSREELETKRRSGQKGERRRRRTGRSRRSQREREEEEEERSGRTEVAAVGNTQQEGLTGRKTDNRKE